MSSQSSGKLRLNKTALKDLFGELPLVPEVYWHLRQPGKPVTAKFTLDKLQQAIPVWRKQAQASVGSKKSGRIILVFATLRYWLEHAAALTCSLAGLGNQVSMAYAPYATWQKPFNRFDLRRQNVYTLSVLEQLSPLVKPFSFVQGKMSPGSLPADLDNLVQKVALKDTQYSLQVEDVEMDSELYRLRLERNRQVAFSALQYLNSYKPDVVVIPNGTILEFGALFQTARWLGTPVVTYEFGEQRERIWLAHNAEVMRQDTTELWQARRDHPLHERELSQVRELFASRQKASMWENFARRWQGVPSEGGEQVRNALGLDRRPIVLLATNVIGDSLTLGRQVFSDSMTEWLVRTVEFFANRPDVQFVIRIHPGELITKGPSVADVVQNALRKVDGTPLSANHIHLIPADARINTYDLVEIADLGLVYTTTVGMEMAMSGVPVIAVGNTHYRDRGFTLDPDSWESYFELLAKVLHQPDLFRPSQAQINLAWNYAYHFFFEYPLPFPWHLVHFWDDIQTWPMERVLGSEGQARFGDTFEYLSGDPIQWK